MYLACICRALATQSKVPVSLCSQHVQAHLFIFMTVPKFSCEYLLQDKQDVEFRRQVQEHLLAGHIPEAMATIEQAAPGTLDSHPRVKFQLQCQQFVEMVCSPCCLELSKMQFAQYTLFEHTMFACLSATKPSLPEGHETTDLEMCHGRSG